MSVAAAAQAVQRSGFPNAYAPHEQAARDIVGGSTYTTNLATTAAYAAAGITLAMLAHAYLAVTAPNTPAAQTRTVSSGSPSSRSDVCWHT